MLNDGPKRCRCGAPFESARTDLLKRQYVRYKCGMQSIEFSHGGSIWRGICGNEERIREWLKQQQTK